LYAEWVHWRKCRKSRKYALKLKAGLIAQKGFVVVDRSIKRQIKAYCRTTFGSSSYWPWLAYNAELRGAYLDGWIPCDYYFFKVIPSLNPPHVSNISRFKTFDHRLFGGNCIQPLLLILGHQIYDSSFNLINRQQAYEVLKNFNAEVVIKQDKGCSSLQIEFMHATEMNLEQFIHKGKSYVIQPVIKQHHILNKIYPLSINSIRILTYMDSSSQIRVLYRLLKVGANGNKTDYIGGQSNRLLFLDETGRVVSNAYNNNGVEVESVHPETGCMYKDIVVPSIEASMKLCVELHYKYPYLGLIGWDVYIDENANPGIIEWNSWMPGFYMAEGLVGPLFDVKELVQRVGR
jgi:hypothetical protein